MAKRAGSESLAVDVYDQLRTEIFDRRLQPGERLKPFELGSRFGVSIGVMREALGLLAAQNLVRIERNRGFHVTTVSAEALRNLTVARKINEGAALRLAVERGDVGWESEALAAHHRMASLPMFTSVEGEPDARNTAWAAAHIVFHQTLISACGNAVLLDICGRLSDEAELYRAWSGGDRVVPRDVAAEHREILEAALAHDADRAVALFEAHVDRTAGIVLDIVAGPQARAERTA